MQMLSSLPSEEQDASHTLTLAIGWVAESKCYHWLELHPMLCVYLCCFAQVELGVFSIWMPLSISDKEDELFAVFRLISDQCSQFVRCGPFPSPAEAHLSQKNFGQHGLLPCKSSLCNMMHREKDFPVKLRERDIRLILPGALSTYDL